MSPVPDVLEGDALAAGWEAGAAETESGDAEAAGTGPEATGELPQALAATASMVASNQIARLFIIVPLSYGSQDQTFCQIQRKGERRMT